MCSIPFNEYKRLISSSEMDSVTQSLLSSLGTGRLKNYTCIMFEMDSEKLTALLQQGPDGHHAVLGAAIEQGERILDILRLYLFKPGQPAGIGRAGGLDNGVSAIWVASDDFTFDTFIARATHQYRSLQKALRVDLKELRIIYTDEVFTELKTMPFCEVSPLGPIMSRIVSGLRAFRESRDIAVMEARFKHLAAIAESLAKKTPEESINQNELRDRISKIATRDRMMSIDPAQVLDSITDLWKNVRNPLSHETQTFSSLGRDANADLRQIELIVVSMIRAVVIAWRMEEFTPPYEWLLKDTTVP